MLKTCFYKESILVEGWEDYTTKQIAVALEEFIKERQKKGFNVAEIVCGGAKIKLPQGKGKVTEEYLWPKLLGRFSSEEKSPLTTLTIEE